MLDESRVQQVLEDLLDAQRTPEEACAGDPELLREVRKRWDRMQRVGMELDALFPSDAPTKRDGVTPLPADADMPHIDGYTIDGVLGRGGMGVVFKAWHLKFKRFVAIKTQLAGPYAAPLELARFRREIEAVAALRHPNIVQIHDVGEVADRHSFTMEFVEGGSLAEKLNGKAQDSRSAADLVATLAQAMQFAHKSGFIHRDLKPANILLTADGIPKIADFGLARSMVEGPDLTLSGARVGTPAYMAPEQAAGKHSALGPAVDIHALGVMLYEMLTGRLPFEGETSPATVQLVLSQEPTPPARVNSRVPRDLETICLKCLHKVPSSRYSTAAELAEDLRRFLDGEAILARPEGVCERAARRFRRRPALSFALLAIVVLAGVGLWLAADKWATEQRQLAGLRASESAADEHLQRMVSHLETSTWDKARAELDQARARLGKDGSMEWLGRLEEKERELKHALRLEAIRLARAARLGKMNAGASADQEYEGVFAAEKLGQTSESPEVVAERIQRFSIRDALVAAVDDWASCTPDPIRQDWLLAVARLADRAANGWRKRARDPAIWKSKSALVELEAQVSVERSSAPLVLTLAECMKKVGADPVPLLKRLQFANQDDFWANLGLAEAHMERNNLLDAIRYYQSAIALRKDASVVHDNLGLALALIGRFEEADQQFRHGSRLDPAAAAHETLGIVFATERRQDLIDMSALPRHFRERVATLHLMLGDDLQEKGKVDEALQRYRQAVAVDARLTVAQHRLRAILLKQGKLQDAWQSWQAATAADPPDFDAWDGYAELCLFLRKDDEYRRVRKIMLHRFKDDRNPRVAELTGRASLLLPPSAHELGQAEILIDRALAAAEKNPFYHFAKGFSEFRQGQWDKSITIMKGEAASVMGPAPRLIEAMSLHQQAHAEQARQTLAAAIDAFDWGPERSDDRNAWIYHILRREAETLVSAK